MRCLLFFPVLLFLLVGCETTDTTGTADVVRKQEVNIQQGMLASDVVSLLGEPVEITTDLEMGDYKMDQWHYEIIVDRVEEYREIDTDVVDLINPVIDPIRPQQMAREEAAHTIFVEYNKVQVLDILVLNGVVFGVKSDFREDYDIQDPGGYGH